MSSIRTSSTALTHAILTAIHPAIANISPFPFPVQIPAELHLMIRTHLRVHIARELLDSLHASLSSSLSALCDDCKSYYAHVFGPHVADWPVVQAGRGCRCTTIGLPSSPRPFNKMSDPCELSSPPRTPVSDKEPPAYFIAHVQHTLAAYATMDPSFPYADRPIASNADLDLLVACVLSDFGWTAIPATTHRNWEFDNDVLIVPSSASSVIDVSAISLDRLLIRLDLAVHEDLLARSPLHPTKVTHFPPLAPPTSTGMSRIPCLPLSLTWHTVTCYSSNPLSATIVSGLLLLVLASPLAFAYVIHVSAH